MIRESKNIKHEKEIAIVKKNKIYIFKLNFILL